MFSLSDLGEWSYGLPVQGRYEFYELARLKRLSVFKAAHRLAFDWFLLMFVADPTTSLQDSGKFCKILQLSLRLKVVLTLNSGSIMQIL